jgi:hypothetical protein
MRSAAVAIAVIAGLSNTIGCRSREEASAEIHADPRADAEVRSIPIRDIPSKTAPAAALVGTWESEPTSRKLNAVWISNAEVEFRIVDPAEWNGAYDVDETRFTLTFLLDGSVRVTDRYRPGPSPAKRFSVGGRTACLLIATTEDGKPLLAEVKPNGSLRVDFVAVRTTMDADPTDHSTIIGCSSVVSGRLSVRLRKVPLQLP